jgi:hypothetical protein
MVIDPQSANLFISEYKRALTEAHRLAGGPPSPSTLQVLASARRSTQESTELLDKAILSLEAYGAALPPEVLRAIRSLRVRQWIYLRDTASYSIFIAPEEREAFAVLGLTNRVRDILGRSAVAFRAGVVEFRGRYVCDGILENHVWIGANYKREFSAMLAELKDAGRMYVACDP